MTEPHVIITRMRDLLAEHPPRPRCEIRCGYAILRWFEAQPTTERLSFTPHPTLSGIPIILDSDLGRGTWVVTEDGVEVERRMIGDGDRVWFVPMAGGFVTTDDETLAAGLDVLNRRDTR